MQFKVRKIKVNGVNINYAKAGKGEPIVLMHGWCNNWYGWKLLADELKKHYTLYLLDMVGFGDSDDIPVNSIHAQARYVIEFINKKRLRPKALVGASMGTIISLKVVEKNPDICENLILIGAPIPSILVSSNGKRILDHVLNYSLKSDITLKVVSSAVLSRYGCYAIERFISAYKFDKDLIDKYSIPGRKLVRHRAYAQLGVSARKFSFEKFFKKTNQKILLIFGEGDGYIQITKTEEFINNFRKDNISFRIVSKGGHNLAYEQPLKTLNVINDYLQSN